MSTENTQTTSTFQKKLNTRVYIGGLSPNVKEEELVKKFEAFGKVLNNKIVKNDQSTFGFVEMETEDAANKAIQALNKTEIDSQVVDVEIAKDRKKRFPRKRSGAPKRDNNNNNTTTTTNTTSPTTTNTNGRRRNNTRRPQGTTPTNNTTTTTTPASTAATTSTSGDANGTSAKPQRKGRLVRARKPQQDDKKDKEQSKTTLFVTNLPYSWGNEDLLAIFKDHAPKDAHIIVNKHTNRSKGFGFVDFVSEDDQQKALALNKKNVKNGDKDREIYVKVAFVADIVQTPDTPTTTTPPTSTA